MGSTSSKVVSKEIIEKTNTFRNIVLKIYKSKNKQQYELLCNMLKTHTNMTYTDIAYFLYFQVPVHRIFVDNQSSTLAQEGNPSPTGDWPLDLRLNANDIIKNHLGINIDVLLVEVNKIQTIGGKKRTTKKNK